MGRLRHLVQVLESFVATRAGSILSPLIGICARAAIGYLYVATDLITIAFDSAVWPLVGFVFMPLTTLAHTWAVTDPRGTGALQLLVVGLCVLADLHAAVSSVRRRKH